MGWRSNAACGGAALHVLEEVFLSHPLELQHVAVPGAAALIFIDTVFGTTSH